MDRLDFEQPIVELEEQLDKAIQLGKDNDADVTKIVSDIEKKLSKLRNCLLYTSPSPRDGLLSRMPSSA